MTDKELKHLRKIDLMEILLAQDRELEHMRTELESARKRADLAEAVIWRFIGSDKTPRDGGGTEFADLTEESDGEPSFADGSAQPGSGAGTGYDPAGQPKRSGPMSFADTSRKEGRV